MICERPASWAALATLTDIQRITWALHQKGLTHRDIARWRGVSKGTVTDCLAEVRRKLEDAERE